MIIWWSPHHHHDRRLVLRRRGRGIVGDLVLDEMPGKRFTEVSDLVLGGDEEE